jgi:pyrimidine operon attenuation protein / uracil phosphoribosyltransferase
MATRLYDAAWICETVSRLADEILANRMPGEHRAIVGLRTRGAILADRLAGLLSGRGAKWPVGYLDATLYRDDLHTGAGLKNLQPTRLPFDLNDRAVILVDDVLSTGRTIRAAMGALFDYGRPSCIRLCAMLDRGGRQLPIHPDFVGARVEVPKGGFVRLKLQEIDPQGDAVYVVGSGDAEP